MSVILANTARNKIFDVSLNLPWKFSNAVSMVLTAESLEATNGMTIGGSPVNADGTQPGTGVSGSVLTVRVLPGSAAWIKLEK
jgi:hypothetical protein